MVGAIADWFAVTALFKHPLGLPIPHTALMPEAQGRAGPRARGVRRRELPPGGDHPRAGRAPRTVSLRVGQWLRGARARTPRGRRGHRRRGPRPGQGAATSTSRTSSEPVLVPRFREEPIAPTARRAARGGGAPTTCTTGSSTWRSRSCTAGCGSTRTPSPRCCRERAPWWAPPRLNEAVTNRHPPRSSAGSRTSAPTRTTTPAAPWTRCWPSSPATCWSTRRRGSGPSGSRSGCSTTRPCCVVGLAVEGLRGALLIGSLQDPSGAVRARLQTEVAAFGARLREDDTTCASGSTSSARTSPSSPSSATAPS